MIKIGRIIGVSVLLLTLAVPLFAFSLGSIGIDEPDLKSDKPLFFRIVFAQDADRSMLGVMDETDGTGTGYNIVYLDDNMDGDLTNDSPQEFEPITTSGNREWMGSYVPKFTVDGPVSDVRDGQYNIDLSLMYLTLKGITGVKFFTWQLWLDNWRYLFIGGDIGLFATAEEAMRAEPIRLGGVKQWRINVKSGAPNAKISVELKDENNCVLRSVWAPTGAGDDVEMLSPEFKLLTNSIVVLEQKIEFG